MPIFYDQLHRKVSVTKSPSRIVSLVPSQTELLYDLGLENKIVGVTRFCIHPKKARKEKTIIGGTKEFDFDKIEQLNPDLIIGNKEENYEKGINYLNERYPVWVSDIYTVRDAFEMIQAIGEMTNTISESNKIINQIDIEFSKLKKTPTHTTIAYLIWNKPFMVAGKNTFINHLIEEIGCTNIFAEENTRYPEITLQDLINKAPDYIFLSSEPYPFKEKNLMEIQTYCLHSKVKLVNGEMFSWYGSRLIKAPKYFNTLL